MDIYNSEEQQVEAIKSWWQENGKSIIAGVVIGFVGLFGWRYYNSYVQQRSEASAAAYQQVMQVLAEQHEKGFSAVSKFIADHGSDTYGDLAALQLSADAVKANKLELAAEQLRRVAEHGVDDEFKPVAGIRLARILLAMNKPADALKALDAVTAEQYKATVAEVRGDALLASAQPEKARAAYVVALQASKNGANPVLQMKLDDLSVAGEKADTPKAK
ncbi:MAG: tetratricopeptide repeat protein [Tolumonas sp.]|nr:tetratricopeptide repeat protein [Tolumonas sp.]